MIVAGRQGNPTVSNSQESPGRWYEGVTRYQWLVLVIASLGWVFDVFEGQIFVASMDEAMPALLPSGTKPHEVRFYTNILLGAFLVGGAAGGVLFGMLSDRIGRTKTMIYTILMYSVFTCLSAFSQDWWHLAVFRFLVAMGVGGEWAVASSLVAEVFPQRARAWSLSIFHASSVFGTLLAAAAGAFIVNNQSLGWRWGFVIGSLPALLIIWVRLSLKESESWREARKRAALGLEQQTGRLGQLFQGRLLRNTLLGVGLAAVGLATFWGTHIYGKDVLRDSVKTQYLAALSPEASAADREALLQARAPELKNWQMIGMVLVTVGGGLGLVSFGPLSERLGRRGAFLLFHLGGLVASVILFQALSGVGLVSVFLPVFGFLTLGMHAGYAVYFPELFPTRLRGTGSGFCFNVGRIVAAPILLLSGWMQKDRGYSLENAATILSFLFLVGVALLLFAPETKGRDLPE